MRLRIHTTVMAVQTTAMDPMANKAVLEMSPKITDPAADALSRTPPAPFELLVLVFGVDNALPAVDLGTDVWRGWLARSGLATDVDGSTGSTADSLLTLVRGQSCTIEVRDMGRRRVVFPRVRRPVVGRFVCLVKDDTLASVDVLRGTSGAAETDDLILWVVEARSAVVCVARVYIVVTRCAVHKPLTQ